MPAFSCTRIEKKALFAMSAKDEKLHVNNKEENWSVQIMQGFKVELVSYSTSCG